MRPRGVAGSWTRASRLQILGDAAPSRRPNWEYMSLQPLPQIRLNLALAYYKTNKLALVVKNLKKVIEEMPNDLRIVMLPGRGS